MEQSLNPQRGLYHGWLIVLTCALLMAFVFAPTINLMGLFVIPMQEEFGVSRTTVMLQMSIGTIATLVISLVAGNIMRKIPLKPLMAGSAIISGLSFLARSLAPNMTVVYIFAIIGGAAAVFLTNIPTSVLINNWFGPKMRGRAMGIAVVGSGVGSMIFNPIYGYINKNYSWRISYQIIAAFIIVVALPMIILTVVPKPADKGLVRIGEDTESAAVKTFGYTVKEAIKKNVFWVISFAFILYSLTTTIFNTNGAAYFTDIGYDAVRAASMISLSSAAIIVGKIVLGIICDKLGSFKGAIIACMFTIAGVALLIVTSTITSMGPMAAIVFGLGNALPSVTLPLLTAEIFGNRDYGTLVSYMNVFLTLGAIIGPILGSGFYDATGSYITAWIIVIVLMIVMAILTFIAGVLHKRNPITNLQ